MAIQRFLITAALPYSNGRLHAGHIAGAYLPADIYVRYRRLRGDEVTFICGSDDNGVAALLAARQKNLSVRELTAFFHAAQEADFRGLGIQFDIYGGTHQPGFADLHSQTSQQFFRRIHDKGYLIKKKSLQLFDAQARCFLPDRYARGTCYHLLPSGRHCENPEAYGDQCEACGNLIDPVRLIDPFSTLTGARPEIRETVHWHLRLKDFEDPLRFWLESKSTSQQGLPPWRAQVLKFALGQIRQGLPERAMTRDLDWGVPVPLDDPDAANKVLYVWFENLIGYISFAARLCQLRGGDWRDYAHWWQNPDCRVLHFIGADNIIFHSLTWPAMLLAEGSHRLPSQVVANSFLNMRLPGIGEEQKFSKSKGVGIWIADYLAERDPDPLRYYLTAIAPETQSSTFDWSDLVGRNNGELVNTLGNLIHRTISFAHQFHEGRVPNPGRRESIDLKHLNCILFQAQKATSHLDAFEFRAALSEIMTLARAGNKYLDDKQPWRQRLQDLTASATTINVALQTVKALSILLAPFLPFSAEKCREMLRLDDEDFCWDGFAAELPPGHSLGAPVVLFRKMEG